jgi:transposase
MVQQLIAQNNEQQVQINALIAKVAALQKNSSNSSKPPSSDMPSAPDRKHNNSRKPTDKKSGGQPGHLGHTRDRVDNPDKVVRCAPKSCKDCGERLSKKSDKIIASSQVADIPKIVITVTEYRLISRVCSKGHITVGSLPYGITPGGSMQLGSNANSLFAYMSVVLLIPYKKLQQACSDLFNLSLSQATIANKLEKAAVAAEPLMDKILGYLHSSKWVGSDETGVRVARKRIWQWIWQNAEASYYVVSLKRDYQTVKDHFGESFKGVLVHDCLGAQNMTKAPGQLRSKFLCLVKPLT